MIVERNGRGYDLGYKLRVYVDPKSILPLVSVLAPANENEKRHAPSLVTRTREVLGKAGARLRSLIADSQLSFLKTQFRLRVNNMRGLLNASVYALLSLLCCVLSREAAENVGRLEKAISPTFFNT